MADIVLECLGLSKRFGSRTAVEDVSFTVAAGEAYGLLGPNGAGKTTTISMICGLLQPDDGVVRVDGRIVDTRAVAAKGAIGYVPQEVALLPKFSARESLRFFGQLYGVRGKELTARAEEALAAVGLTERANELVDTYSGGMKRRANLAAALIHRPMLLVLDEPTVGVDPQSRYAIFDMVERLKDEGLAILYASHYMEEVERLCDRVGILDAGTLIAEGTRHELIDTVGESGHVDLVARGPLETFATECRRLARVDEVTVADDGLRIVVREPAHLLPHLLQLADGTGVQVSSVQVKEPDLETVFLRLTGKALRD